MAYGDSSSASLSAVRAAIARCLTTQAYSIRGRSQQLAELRTLREMEKELTEESLNSGSMATVGIQSRPT